ncbi:MAG: sensor histidine kinase [Eubacteriales bacterium]
MITNFEYNNDLRETVENDISNETWRIVNGMISFEEGKQNEYLSEIYSGIVFLEEQSIIEDKTKLELAKRTTKTLEEYIFKLKDQIDNGAKVDDTVETNEEIRSVSLVVSEMLEEFSNEEITAVAQLNKTIQTIQNIFLIFILLMVVGFIRAMSQTKMKLVTNIKGPIKQLEAMAGEIANGDFDIQIADAKIEELASLTQSLNIMAGKLENLIEENKREQQNLKKAEMRLLQAQIKPHFLYNTYDTIIWLAEEKRNSDVIDVVEALSTFYRISLSKGNEWISIENEIKHVESYLRIQRYRYGKILDYDIDINSEINNILILKLLMQPLVENAIYHGIKQVRGIGKITIKGIKKGNHVELSVSDTGIGMDKEELRKLKRSFYNSQKDVNTDGSGYGLSSVFRRVRLFYGSSGKLLIESEKNKGTTVTLKLSIDKKAEA